MRIAFLTLVIGLAACASPPPPAPADPAPAIERLLGDQADAWNRGDIPGFMTAYQQSDTLRFASGGTVTRGWQATLDRYLARYDNREKMGTLSFSELEITTLGSDAAVVHGRWLLQREADTPWGLFTLVLRQIEGEWQIISDTTTSAD